MSLGTEKGYEFIRNYYEVMRNHQITITPCLTSKGLNALPTVEDELPWVDVFSLCQKSQEFVELYKKGDVFMRNHIEKRAKRYQYTHHDLMMALSTLQDYFVSLQSDTDQLKKSLKDLYCVKVFEKKVKEKWDTWKRLNHPVASVSVVLK